jgi:hypothetical protein
VSTTRGLAGAVVAVALAVTTGASAEVSRIAAIDPGTPVNGMLVVQGLEREADVSLFTPFCDPIVVSRTRPETRTCSALPPSSTRIFIGYGLWGVSRKIVDRAWKKRSWALWIDGQRVSLSRFGTNDRWIPSLAEADGRPVLLREWSIILVGAKGRHSIRYSSQLPHSVHSTTWRFTVLER